MASVVLFDLDGTLVETMPAFAELAATVLSRWYGLPGAEARAAYLRTSGLPFHLQLRELFGLDPRNAGAALEFERRKDPIARATQMERRCLSALRTLRTMGMRLVVSSNGVQAHISRFAEAYPRMFCLALGATAEGGKGEWHVRKVCQALSVEREELLFVGDSLRDGELASQSGVQFVARSGTFSRTTLRARFPDAPVIDHVAELPSLVTRFEPLRKESA